MRMLTVMAAMALPVSLASAQSPVPSASRRPVAEKLAARTPSNPVARSDRTPAITTTPKPRGARRARVVVDAGHGGRDPGGPMAGALAEKDIALQVALKVGDALRARGIEVIYTRTTDTLVARADRGRIANTQRGDVFISIHVNAANPKWRNPGAARGFETYFLGVATTEDARRVEQMEESAVQFENAPDEKDADPLSFILNDMIQNEHLRESSDLAELVQRNLRRVHPGPDRGVKQAAFTVLVASFMPAILVELGFGTNILEAAYMAQPAKQRDMARAIATATAEYLERHQRRVGDGAAPRSHD